ncbi:mechanosensitive ion channel domain-containing protein [Halobaculum litoreum]|uniref:Mechanosensitive ion channel domain-containing protein n=1 Tax=Halobaculum litoreum TaxID=3031998 RepID=A0ABD5XMN7_9EURY
MLLFLAQSGLPPVPIPAALRDSSGELLDVVVFLGVTLAVYLLARATVFPLAVRAVRARNRNNPTVQSATETYLAVALAGVALVAGVIAAGYGAVFADSALLIAALTFAVGTAGRDVLGSLVSGLFLVADPDFNVGDWIRWPGGEGTVEAVDFRVTRIRTVDYETVTVPNTELTSNAITRPFGRDRFRVTETVRLAYDDDVDRARAARRGRRGGAADARRPGAGGPRGRPRRGDGGAARGVPRERPRRGRPRRGALAVSRPGDGRVRRRRDHARAALRAGTHWGRRRHRRGLPA